MSEAGSRYILTVVDYATRYPPEAIALREITTEHVAEALYKIFSRVGLPAQILSDQGTQFVSGVMDEVMRLLSIERQASAPYHSKCNGLVEKFNGTLKSMIKKLCAEKPRDWDRYLEAALFAYREVPQDSTGFAPFELLYGRTVRGPLTVLRELWTKEIPEGEVKTTYQYVFDLRNRIEETCRIAEESIKSTQTKMKTHYDKKARVRDLAAGDKVLVLLPSDNNKLLMHWKGPFEVLERIGLTDYRIDQAGRTKVFHLNMLKRYYERQ